MNRPTPTARRPRQRGFSLIAVLIMMIVVALLGIGAMNSGIVQERMAGNAHDMNIALQAAEAALREAERDVEENLTDLSPFVPACTDGLCEPPSMAAVGAVSTPAWQLVDWSSAAVTREYGEHTAVERPLPAAIRSKPRYIVERLPAVEPPPGQQGIGLGGGRPPEKPTAFRITARATGMRDTTVVTLQSIYIRQP